MMSRLFGMLVVLMPWPLKRFILQRWYGYKLDSTARIGLAWVFPKRLEMGPGSTIAHFTVAVNLDEIILKDSSTIGRSNWITGFPTGTASSHFRHQIDRTSELILGNHSAITKNHHLDCTSPIHIGDFVTIAGYFSQLLTHSVDLNECRQSSAPISIGDYTFVGTNVVILGGATLPSHSVLAASSVLNKAFESKYRLYAGVPAKEIRELSEDTKYFHRATGFIE